jgi:hypothetical protein
MAPDTVLSLGADAELLWLREIVLQHAGFNVFSTSDRTQAVLEIQSGRCGVLLLCHSLENEVRRELANEFRKSCPEGRIVAITNDKVSELPVNTDAFVYGLEGPEALIAALRGESTEPSVSEAA